MKTTVLVFLLPLSLLAQDTFEEPPVLSAAAILKPDAFLNNPAFSPSVGEHVAVVALEWDYAAWTQNAAHFVAQLKSATYGGKAPAGHVIALSGDASPMAQQRLKEAGITLATRLAPGPLK